MIGAYFRRKNFRENKSFQMAGWKRISRGNNSSLPASISNISRYFVKGVKWPKFWVGPTNYRPGPILLKVAATAVKFVIKSLPSKEMANTEAANNSI